MKKIQNVTVSHLNEKEFKGGGLRKYSKYRDLGVAKATNGLAHAQVIRRIGKITALCGEVGRRGG